MAAGVAVGVALAVMPAGSGTAVARTSCSARWRVVARTRADLVAVAALSDSNVWAVGTVGKGLNPNSVVAHWNGAHLKVTTGPRGDSLRGIDATSPSNVWAVGASGEDGLLEHWDGAAWSRLALPPGVGSLDDIVLSSPSSGWAVGATYEPTPLALRWDGTRWRRHEFVYGPGKQGWLYSVGASSANDVWAVGETGEAGSVNFLAAYAVRWNGKRWSVFGVPAGADFNSDYGDEDYLVDVSAASRTEAWAIHGGGGRNDIQRWQGRRWRSVRVFRGLTLNGVTALRGQAWAFGSRSRHPAVLHWNGRRWSPSKAPITRVRGSLVAGSALSRRDIWAVGSGLVARYGC